MCANTNDKELVEVIARSKKRMAAIAIDHLKQIDTRTVTSFHKHGIFIEQKLPDIYEDTLAILQDKKHSNRIPVLDGPLLFHRKQGDKPVNLAINVSDLFFSENIKLRKAALAHFEEMITNGSCLLTPKSETIIKQQKDKFLSTTSQEWQQSAITLSDIIKDDWLSNLAAVKQCLAINFQKGVEEHLTRLIRPSISSIDSIIIGVWAATEQVEEIKKSILKCIDNSESFEDALSAYYKRFGHIPLAKELSIIQIVEEWEKRNGKIKDIWTTLWNWADEIKSPLPRYHICYFFINHANLIPQNSYSKLWDEITEIVHMPNNEDSEQQWTQTWRIRCELARHFCHHIEYSLPGTDGERIASQAWWLAEKLSSIFGVSCEELRSIREITFIPEERISSEIWSLSRPLVKPSDLRYATTLIKSMWSLSLQCQLGQNLDSLNPTCMTSESRSKIENSLCGSIISVFPISSKGKDEGIYAFDNTIIPTAYAWCDKEKNEDMKEKIQVFIKGASKISKEEEFRAGLKKLVQTHKGDQVLILMTLRYLAYAGNAPLDLMWECISDKDWLSKLLLKFEPTIVELFFDSLLEIQTRNNDKWQFQLPHFLASVCESVQDAKRRKLLFSLVILSSIVLNSTSAINRILTGSKCSDFKESIDYWKQRIESAKYYAPLWVKAKLRAIMTCLNSF